jgi:hypothetical protein
MRSAKLLVVVAAGALLFAWRCTERSPAPEAANPGVSARTRASEAGYTVHRDPKTGALREPTAAEQAAAQSSHSVEATSSSAEGLQAMQSPVPGGGVVMRLNGRFHNSMMATRQDDGTPWMQCLDSQPPAGQLKEGAQ